jgi:head-tail adaptor
MPRTELVRDEIAQVRNQVQVTIRYRNGITPDMRFVLRGVYDRTVRIISGPHEMGRHERLLMVCEEYSS